MMSIQLVKLEELIKKQQRQSDRALKSADNLCKTCSKWDESYGCSDKLVPPCNDYTEAGSGNDNTSDE